MRVSGAMTTRWASRKGPKLKGFISLMMILQDDRSYYTWAKKVTHAPSRSSENAREHHLLELHEGRSVALDPGPKHGTFPGINEKARKGRGGQIQPDPFCLLSLSHAGLDRTRPRRVDRRQA